MSDDYECANCGEPSGHLGHYDISRDAFYCETEVVLPARCKECGMSGAHFCPGRPADKRRWEMEVKQDLEAFRMLAGPEKCKKHRQYKAIRRPRTTCEACWRLWIAAHPA